MTSPTPTTLTPVTGIAWCTAHNDVTHGTLSVCLSADGSPRPCVIVPLWFGDVERPEVVRVDELAGIRAVLAEVRSLLHGLLAEEDAT
jgi:hypothetical protein